MPQTQRGSVRRLDSGRWQLRYYDAAGKRQTGGSFATRSAAYAHYREQIEPRLSGHEPRPCLTLAELADVYLERHAAVVRRRTIGIRVPDHPVPQALLLELGEPLMSSTLLLPGDELPMTDAREIQERLYHVVDAVIDGGNCGLEPTTVIDLEGPAPLVARRGKGDVNPFL